MRDILNTITKWWAADETFGLATVVSTFRSAPRDPGAALAEADLVLGLKDGGTAFVTEPAAVGEDRLKALYE